MTDDRDRAVSALREACHELSLAADIPDARVLEEVIRRYPEFSDELTQLAIDIALDALQAEPATEEGIDPTAVSPAVSRALSHFQDRLHALTAGEPGGRAGLAPGADPPNPFLSLDRAAFRSLATRLNANTVFVCKLRDRQIDPATLTPGFKRRVAAELGAPLALVQAHFAARASLRPGQFYKASDKPAAGAQQSFAEALASSGLGEREQQWLLAL